MTAVSLASDAVAIIMLHFSFSFRMLFDSSENEPTQCHLHCHFSRSTLHLHTTTQHTCSSCVKCGKLIVKECHHFRTFLKNVFLQCNATLLFCCLLIACFPAMRVKVGQGQGGVSDRGRRAVLGTQVEL